MWIAEQVKVFSEYYRQHKSVFSFTIDEKCALLPQIWLTLAISSCNVFYLGPKKTKKSPHKPWLQPVKIYVNARVLVFIFIIEIYKYQSSWENLHERKEYALGK